MAKGQTRVKKKEPVQPDEIFTVYKFGKSHIKENSKQITIPELIIRFELHPSFEIFKTTRYYPSLVVGEWFTNKSGANFDHYGKLTNQMTAVLCEKYGRKNERDVI